jgi:hypothetical protein
MTVCDHGQKDLWNTLIGRDDDIYYHWAYSDAFYQVGSGLPTLFYLSDGRTRIYTVLMSGSSGRSSRLRNSSVIMTSPRLRLRRHCPERAVERKAAGPVFR